MVFANVSKADEASVAIPLPPTALAKTVGIPEPVAQAINQSLSATPHQSFFSNTSFGHYSESKPAAVTTL